MIVPAPGTGPCLGQSRSWPSSWDLDWPLMLGLIPSTRQSHRNMRRQAAANPSRRPMRWLCLPMLCRRSGTSSTTESRLGDRTGFPTSSNRSGRLGQHRCNCLQQINRLERPIPHAPHRLGSPVSLGLVRLLREPGLIQVSTCVHADSESAG
jgi:hypothetical protein